MIYPRSHQNIFLKYFSLWKELNYVGSIQQDSNLTRLSAACWPGAEPLRFREALQGPSNVFFLHLREYLEGDWSMACKYEYNRKISAISLVDKPVIVRLRLTRYPAKLSTASHPGTPLESHLLSWKYEIIYCQFFDKPFFTNYKHQVLETLPELVCGAQHRKCLQCQDCKSHHLAHWFPRLFLNIFKWRINYKQKLTIINLLIKRKFNYEATHSLLLKTNIPMQF